MVTRAIFKVNGKWQPTWSEDAEETRYVEMNLEDDVNVDMKKVLEYFNKGCGKAGSYGVMKHYGFSEWADQVKGNPSDFEKVDLDDYDTPKETTETEVETATEETSTENSTTDEVVNE